MLVPDYAGESSSAGDSSAAEGWRVAKVDIKLGAIVLAFLVGGVLGAALVGIIGAGDHDDALAAAVPLPAGATLVASGAGAGCGAATTSGGDDPSLVTTPDGVLRGSVNPDQRTRTFYAVPYALSPTGTQRWRPPVQTEGWSGERDATLAAKKDGCARAAYGMMAGQEDCLYVNVFAPLSRPDVDPKPLPVLVWFHGGCFISNGPETAWGGDGAALVDDAGGDVIVVTVAFRIGVFGHLASAGLKNRSDHEATAGNWGLLDQREAMRWVRRNIAAWGGDPGNVCIFGHSSGAASVSAHLVMEQSWPLFHKAIVQSGAFPSWGAHSWEAALRNYDRTIRGLACDAASGFATEEQQISCLTAKDWQDVATAGASVGVPCRDGCPWAPVVDGVELVDFPMRRVEEGQHATGKPLIMTSTEDDGATYTYMASTGPALDPAAPPPPPNPWTGEPTPAASVTQADLEIYWSQMFGDAAVSDLRRLYSPSDYAADAAETALTVSAAQYAGFRSETDVIAGCGAKWAAEKFSSSEEDGASSTPPPPPPPRAVDNIYLLQFAFGYNSAVQQEATHRIPVTHGAETAFMFSEPQQYTGVDWSRLSELSASEMSEPVRLADIMVGYWTNFAKTGDPNGLTDLGQQLPVWPSTTGSRDTVGDHMLRVAGADPGDITVLNSFHSAACEWWRGRWGVWDAESCSDQCFGGCIPCDGHRLDFSSHGEPPAGAC